MAPSRNEAEICLARRGSTGSSRVQSGLEPGSAARKLAQTAQCISAPDTDGILAPLGGGDSVPLCFCSSVYPPRQIGGAMQKAAPARRRPTSRSQRGRRPSLAAKVAPWAYSGGGPSDRPHMAATLASGPYGGPLQLTTKAWLSATSASAMSTTPLGAPAGSPPAPAGPRPGDRS